MVSVLELRVPWHFFRIWSSLLVKVHFVLYQTPPIIKLFSWLMNLYLMSCIQCHVNSGAGNGSQLGNVSCFWLLSFMVVDIEGNNSMMTGASKIEDVQVKKRLCKLFDSFSVVTQGFQEFFSTKYFSQIQWLWWLWFTGESTSCQAVYVLSDFGVGGHHCASFLKAKGLLSIIEKSWTVQSPLAQQVCFAPQTSYLDRFIPSLAWPVWFMWNITSHTQLDLLWD